MKPAGALLAITLAFIPVARAQPVELKKVGSDRFVFFAGDKELATLMPDAWQGNLNILSPKTNMLCGVNWPHFLLYSEGKWLTDRVESEGLKLVGFDLIKTSGPVIGYTGRWQFRDYCASSECHFAWHDATNAMQFHLIRTKIEILKDLPDISGAWTEFMTTENSYSTVAAKISGGKVITMDVSGTGKNANMHHWDGYDLDDHGWISIYGARKGQQACVAMVPLQCDPGPIHPRINNGHVDNIELHMLDARKQNLLKRGQTFVLEYLLIVAPDQADWKWIELAAQNGRIFIGQNPDLFHCP